MSVSGGGARNEKQLDTDCESDAEGEAATQAARRCNKRDVPALLTGAAAAALARLPLITTLVNAVARLRSTAGKKLDGLLPAALEVEPPAADAEAADRDTPRAAAAQQAAVIEAVAAQAAIKTAAASSMVALGA